MRHALILGGTGAVGSALVRELLASPRWRSVTIFVRRSTGQFAGLPGADRLVERVLDLDAIAEAVVADPPPAPLSAFCTLGVGQPRKVSREELHRVDVGIASAFARGCRDAEVSHFSLLTAVGASATSRSHYLHVKGEIEEAVERLGFERTSFFRPSMLLTREMRYGLQDRVAHAIFPRLSPFLPSRLHEITVEDLATAMRVNAEREGVLGREVLEYEDFVRLLR